VVVNPEGGFVVAGFANEYEIVRNGPVRLGEVPAVAPERGKESLDAMQQLVPVEVHPVRVLKEEDVWRVRRLLDDLGQPVEPRPGASYGANLLLWLGIDVVEAAAPVGDGCEVEDGGVRHGGKSGFGKTRAACGDWVDRLGHRGEGGLRPVATVTLVGSSAPTMRAPRSPRKEYEVSPASWAFIVVWPCIAAVIFDEMIEALSAILARQGLPPEQATVWEGRAIVGLAIYSGLLCVDAVAFIAWHS
jgi:hypothetical protein